ncbi:putative Ubiquitin-like domain-containing protein [Helianthus debilis subsp. tardiflorus]
MADNGKGMANEGDRSRNLGDIKMMSASGEIIPLNVKGSDSIATIKLKIAFVEGTPFEQQELVFNQMVLEDIYTLANLRIRKDSTITLMLKSKIFMSIFIKLPDGMFLSLDVKSSDTISHVKAKIPSKHAVHALVFNEIVLEDSGTLADFNIINESTLTCIGKSQPTMEIFVNTFTGKTISLLVNPTDTLADVKLKIECDEGILVDEQVLIFNNVVLRDSGTIFYYNINRKSTLTLMCKSRGLMRIFINIPTGESITLKVKSSDTIGNLKTKIQDKMHVPYDEQEMIFNEMVLDNMDTLAEHNIKRESTLTLMRISTVYMRIFIKTLTGSTVTLEVKPSDTVRYVKSKFHEKEDTCALINLRLIFNGRQLEDGLTLAEYHILNESTIQCFPRLGGGWVSEGVICGPMSGVFSPKRPALHGIP